jgi:hypothetical protein
VTGIDRRPRQDRYTPGRTGADILADRKALFTGLNKFIIERGGFVVSIPGAPLVTFEVLESSTLPDVMRDELGYDVVPADPPEGTRLLAAGITELLSLTSSGAFEPATENSTKTTIERHHTGIVRVLRYTFTMP